MKHVLRALITRQANWRASCGCDVEEFAFTGRKVAIDAGGDGHGSDAVADAVEIDLDGLDGFFFLLFFLFVGLLIRRVWRRRPSCRLSFCLCLSSAAFSSSLSGLKGEGSSAFERQRRRRHRSCSS